MLKSIVAALSLSMLGGVAIADRGHEDRHDRGPTVRDHRVNRPAQRADRREVSRRPVYLNNGHYAFAGGTSHVFVRPVIRTHYYNARTRPVMLTENYQDEPGYVWVRGQWSWSGREWLWGDGHFVADPQYSRYYDDGSYDYQVNFRL